MSEFGHRKIKVLELVYGIVPLLGSAQAEQLMGHFEKFKTKEISKAGFIRLMKHIAGDQNIEMVARQLKSQGGIIRSMESARDQSALQSQVPYQLQNLPTPSVEMQDNLIFLEPMQFAPPVPILAHETVLDNFDSQSTADTFDQSALQSQVSMQQQNSATSSPVLPDLDGVQLFQLEQEWEPPALPTPSLNKLQPHMQCGHVLLPTYDSAGEIQHQLDELLSSNIPAAISSKTPAKKPKVGKKKSLTKKPPPSRKKQKVSGAFSDQTIKQINDVTSVSGVNLREEEEQMFSGPKRDSLVSEASQQIVQEEEDKLILEKKSTTAKTEENCNDVERCLSLCVEERMRGLIGNLIRLSKQRLDVDKLMNRTVVTSDIGHQIMLLNRKAQDEWKTKQAEREKPQKHNEMHLLVANVAARSKWQQMAERAKQERGGTNSGSGPQPRNTGQKMNTPKGETKKGGRSQGFVAQLHTITVKDVIAVLEREPHMSESALIYKLYEKIPSDAATAT